MREVLQARSQFLLQPPAPGLLALEKCLSALHDMVVYMPPTHLAIRIEYKGRYRHDRPLRRLSRCTVGVVLRAVVDRDDWGATDGLLNCS